MQAFALKVARIDGIGTRGEQDPRIAQARYVAFRPLEIDAWFVKCSWRRAARR